MYEPLSAENHPEVAASEVVLSSMLLHVRQRERLREHRAQREQRELREACTNKLLMQLRAARERVRMCVFNVCIYVYMYLRIWICVCMHACTPKSKHSCCIHLPTHTPNPNP